MNEDGLHLRRAADEDLIRENEFSCPSTSHKGPRDVPSQDCTGRPCTAWFDADDATWND